MVDRLLVESYFIHVVMMLFEERRCGYFVLDDIMRFLQFLDTKESLRCSLVIVPVECHVSDFMRNPESIIFCYVVFINYNLHLFLSYELNFFPPLTVLFVH